MLKSIRSRAVVTYLLVAVISLTLAALVSFLFLSFYTKDLDKKDLQEGTVAVARNIEQAEGQLFLRPRNRAIPGEEERRSINLLGIWLNSQSQVLDAKLLAADEGGRLIAESPGAPHLARRGTVFSRQFLPEKEPITDVRTIPGFEGEYLYVSVPMEVFPDNQGFLISLKPARDIGGAAATLTWYIIFAALISLGVSALVALFISGAIARPIRDLAAAARRMAEGDYSARVETRSRDEVGELGKNFNLMADRVSTAYEMQQDFVGNVSHELRTPLTSIEGFSQALIDGTVKDKKEVGRALGIIKEESARMKQILNDLLLLSQIDAGQFRPEMERLSLSFLINKLRSVFEPRAISHDIDFRVVMPEREVDVVTDGSRLEQVLSNLLENAFKYTGAGGRIVLSYALGDSGEVNLSVADTGSGIDPGELPQIFERFYRTEKSRDKKLGGVGLGLSLCKELIETLEGSISVASVPGEGTTFTVRLPRTTF